MKTLTIEHSTNDIIIKRFDDTSILRSQALVLLNFLPNCVIYEPYPLNVPGKVQGASTKIFTGIFEQSTNLNGELDTIYKGISEFINHLNKDGKTVSRIDCILYQSDTKTHIPHTSNNPSNDITMPTGSVYKRNWVFGDIFKVKDHHKQEVYCNKFTREVNDVEPMITHKYWTLCIESSWGSI